MARRSSWGHVIKRFGNYTKEFGLYSPGNGNLLAV